MKKALEIFWNDIKTVKNSPVVLFVIAVIICIPALYAVFNIQATLDPYSKTSNIKVAVVNEDRGVNFEGEKLNVGAEFVDELRNNRNFDWQFVDRSEAMNGLREGDYYAVLIIPGNFSSDLLSIKNGTPRQASIEYIVNDKLNPVAPRITNAGADALQAKINSEVVKTIDGIIFGKISSAGELARANRDDILRTKKFISELNANLGKIDETLSTANSDLEKGQNLWSGLKSDLPEIQENANFVKEKYSLLESYIGKDPAKALSTVQSMESHLSEAIASMKYLKAVLGSLYSATGDPKLKTAMDQIDANIQKANSVLGILEGIETDLKTKGTTERLVKLRESLNKMDSALNKLMDNRAQIDAAMRDASSKLGIANSKWPVMRSAIQDAHRKLGMISEDDLNSLVRLADIDPSAVREYFRSPVKMEKEHIYPVKNYGSALAPFYIPISLWIGGIIAVAMISMRVKYGEYSSIQVYFGRMGLFIIIAICQALVVAAGALLLQVQITGTLLFLLTALYVSICSMLIIYSLTSALGNAGKALSIIILVLQITGTGGIFPVELLPPFFQAIHPYLPLTYAVGALREVVAGVIWSIYWKNMALLALFPVVTFLITVLVKEKMDKRAHWMESKLEESGLF
ncbi:MULTISPECIES: YhgE/Pip domain-containing protein [Methanothermobacter]|uniref:Predicted phage infection protein n=1 Tax=Methanothermobacter marburgensis (strain ATCC BAA-927 / DSM 2133 / JCM 14651 / NBRC 100331 / OCM 82 / Marburg) TaxID=79929 RepID=D9PUY2_METTM|nr:MULTISPECIES: YhgE/Pip domain-containing protein [Methanothermobacter]ADL58029.1 predicted phage infection protein [Methanothermobacter marburgensis str. Marburg]QHN08466.1 YhgE/Pip domain-containing protein [Methanothermobacter sp. THM-2]WBF10217.1 YhgE/Pip domain-containing protein [Methanothermobacter marburgensis]